MISQNDNDVALTVLRKYDPKCQMILDSSNKVKLYNYDKTKNTWVIKDESEGALYLVKRYIPPLYKFIILSKYNKPGSHLCPTEIPLSQYLISQINQTFYMFKNEFGIIQAIFFPNKPDCERFCIKVERIIKELKAESDKLIDLTPVISKPRFVESIEGILSNSVAPDSSACLNGKEKILSMLESARHRYEDVHVEKWSRQIDIQELFQSTTNNVTPAGVNTPGLLDPPLLLQHQQHQQQQHQQHQQHHHHSLMQDCSSSSPSSASLSQTRPHSCRPIPTAVTIQHGGSKLLPPTDKLDQSTSISAASTPITPGASRNGPNTLTVTELEKYLVQNATVSVSIPSAAVANQNKVHPDEDEDDSLLLSPNKFQNTVDSPLNREQLRDALIHLLQNDDDGSFVAKVHSAYLQTFARK